MKVLYVSDLDGTLLTSKECISDYSINILNRLLLEGVCFTYATARSLKTALSATVGLNISTPVIVYNGALVVTPVDRQIIHKITFGHEIKKYILSVLNSVNINPFVFGLKDGAERVSWIVNRENDPMKRYLSRRQGDGRMRAVDTSKELEDIDAFYFNCMGTADEMFNAYNIFSRDNRLTCIIHQETYREDYWLEILCKDATKAEAVKKIKEIYGFEKVVSFGDSVNDIPMFEVSDERYAVMNADETLKQRATGIIGYCEEDGVAKWLDKNAVIKE